MDRRGFLLATVAGGVGLGLAGGRADALVLEECGAGEGSPACRELVRHRDLVAEIERLLAERGLSDAERRAVLAFALCPFCGQPVAPPAPGAPS